MRVPALLLALALAACAEAPPTPVSLAEEIATEAAATDPATRAAHPAAGLPAFGQLVPACGIRGKALGAEVDRYPRDGRAQWRLHDPQPGATGPHLQYLTGFRDGCPRRVTAALGIFGRAAMHEVERYGGDEDAPWSPVDLAYEQMKRPICGTAPRQPCPETRLSRVEKRLAFLTLYPRYGAESGWASILLADGKAVAQTLRR